MCKLPTYLISAISVTGGNNIIVRPLYHSCVVCHSFLFELHNHSVVGAFLKLSLPLLATCNRSRKGSNL